MKKRHVELCPSSVSGFNVTDVYLNVIWTDEYKRSDFKVNTRIVL